MEFYDVKAALGVVKCRFFFEKKLKNFYVEFSCSNLCKLHRLDICLTVAIATNNR